MMPYRTLLLGVCLCAAGLQAAPAGRAPLTVRERTGKQIYLRGESPSGRPIMAVLGDPPMEVSARMLPCVNCHGYDGRGRPEGGLTPSNIAWSVLTKSYGTVHELGRRHGPYTEALFRRAIEKRLDPSGNVLGVGMPAFRMSDDDFAALLAYVKRIETDRDPGVTATEVTLATVLPLEGRLAEVGRAVRTMLTARFEEANAAGGVYGRRIRLRVVPAGDSPKTSIDRLSDMLDAEEIFALVAPLIPGGEDGLASLAAEREIPVVLPLGRSPESVGGPNRFLFYLFSSPSVQARTLVDHLAGAARADHPAEVTVIYRDDETYTRLLPSIREQCKLRHVSLRVLLPYAEKDFHPDILAWKVEGAPALIFLGPDGDCARLLKAATGLGLTPRVYLLGEFLSGDIFSAPHEMQDRLFVAFPNSRSAESPATKAQYESFAREHDISAAGSSVVRTAHCAATLFTHALKGAGKEVRREQLIRELEGLYEFETGLTPPLTYGPSLRVGAYGAYIVGLDLAGRTFVCTNRWINPSD